ncbi:DUF2515 family protein [Alkalihalobacterium chitinilyticum]|uniref:DUF2515 domain-containing protein n=1 Tax=Alkalihalobacterium chitinilyticum TaxID=2980103 RepID=A0ABT5V8W1_9BACI|nr:DUF2515 family protein [Alkalihalobacterium chitinilyticum]MDE5411875.1 DUF2515 domain-containing protein [Alkalihalobacterium chitinilyticum]
MWQKENGIVSTIKKKTIDGNIDNISRTKAYLKYYKNNQEIWWALLASMVSRNAGWNMTDLKSNWYETLITPQYSYTLFLTFERANWLIFSDAYPQLLIYEVSKKEKQPLFHLLPYFDVSEFMIREWNIFWNSGNLERLCTALIINEQHLIQGPVIEHPFYSSHVFKSLPYFLVEHLHFNTVLFPTFEGNLYGFSVDKFQKVERRIELGKKLAWLLFKSEQSSPIHRFALQVEPTGSRRDYEKYVKWKILKHTPILRTAYSPVLHQRHDYGDWSLSTRNVKRFFKSWTEPRREYRLTSWYQQKMAELFIAMKIETTLIKAFR